MNILHCKIKYVKDIVIFSISKKGGAKRCSAKKQEMQIVQAVPGNKVVSTEGSCK